MYEMFIFVIYWNFYILLKKEKCYDVQKDVITNNCLAGNVNVSFSSCSLAYEHPSF